MELRCSQDRDSIFASQDLKVYAIDSSKVAIETLTSKPKELNLDRVQVFSHRYPEFSFFGFNIFCNMTISFIQWYWGDWNGYLLFFQFYRKEKVPLGVIL